MQAMKKKGWKVIAVSPPDNYVKKLKAKGIHFWELPINRKGMNPLEDFLMFCRLLKFYRREKPLIVHHFTIKPVIYGSLAARISGIAGIVNLVPGLGYVFSRGGLIQYIVERMYRFVLFPKVQVIFQNPDDRTFFIKRKLAINRQTHLICGSGVDVEFFSPDKFFPIDPSPSIAFTLISRMLWDKGIAEFVEAAKAVKKKNALTRFILIGDSDKGNPAAIPVSWLKKQDHIEWIEHTDDIRPWLARSAVVVLPSYREGAPRALIEAAAMAKAIITTNVPGCREIVKNGINGLVVPSKNVELLAQSMLRLANDPILRKQMGIAGREKALKNFDERLVIRKTQEIYNLIEFIN